MIIFLFFSNLLNCLRSVGTIVIINVKIFSLKQKINQIVPAIKENTKFCLVLKTASCCYFRVNVEISNYTLK